MAEAPEVQAIGRSSSDRHHRQKSLRETAQGAMSLGRRRLKYEKAEKFLRKWLDGLHNKPESNTRLVARICCYLAVVLALQGRYEEAAQYQSQALADRFREFGEHDPDTVFSMSNLSAILYRQREHRLAKNLAQYTLKASRRCFGQEHWKTFAACHNLAVICATMGELDEAHSIITLAVQNNHHKHTDRYHQRITLASTMCMGWIQHARGHYVEAVQLYRQACCLVEKFAGEDSALKLTCERLATGAENSVVFEPATRSTW